MTEAMAKRCRSRAKIGACGLDAGHEGDHAVPIGDGVWYAYQPGGKPVGYGRLDDGQWVAL